MMQALMLALALVQPKVAAPPPAVCPVPDSIGHCVYFTMERQGVKPEKYTVNVREDGKVHYWIGDLPEDKPEDSLHWYSAGSGTIKKIFDAVPIIDGGECETHEKNIANTGKKTLIAYEGDQAGKCVFNYSDESKVNDAASAFQAIAETIQAGDRLKYKKRFDHLGLDAELDGLISQVKAGYAIELQNIAPILQSIADDDEFLATVRRKATSLLTMAVVPGAKKP